MDMRGRKFGFKVSILLILAILIHLFSCNEIWVEYYYSTGIFPYISNFLKYFNSIFPFSLGDILYGIVFLWLFALLIRLFQGVYRHTIRKDDLKIFAKNSLLIILGIYIAFNLLWGINYNRKGIAYQLGFTLQKYSTNELEQLNAMLVQKVNESKLIVLKNKQRYTNKKIFSESGEAYKEVAKNYPFLKYNYSGSVKSSMWGWLGNYSGFLGYYNPFTGEAQVNTTIPDYIQAFTTCHEIAHQLGYAKEDEANFVGYLASVSSRDTFFRYSVYLDMLVYANRNLYAADSSAARNFAKQLLPEVRTDLMNWRKFLHEHQSPVEPIVRWIYGKYLQGNQQPAGVYSYDEVSGFLIGYYKKFGKI
jgi:hypothetical protein